MKLKLTEDWRRGRRWISVNCMTVVAAVQGTWMLVPDDLKAGIPAEGGAASRWPCWCWAPSAKSSNRRAAMLTSLLSSFGGYIVAAVVALVGVAGAYLRCFTRP